MDGRTLMAAMAGEYPPPLPLSRYNQLAPGATLALRRAGCTTVRRAAAFLAQVGAESGSLRWTEELADGSAYNWRTDLGNTQAGDGPRFKGRTFIQITGRHNYGNLSRWAHEHGYCPTADYFISHPDALASDAYVWLGPVWYWTVARPGINADADSGDIDAVTYAVNGGYNNASGRRQRWDHALTLGTALLAPRPPEEFTVQKSDEATIRAIVAAEVAKQVSNVRTWQDVQREQTARQLEAVHTDLQKLTALVQHGAKK